jgi:carbon-monoxide dehydrogenase medium subunit
VTDNAVGFEYYEPTTLDDALDLLAREGDDGAALAGGTDLLLRMRRRLQSYGSVVNLKRIPGLNEIRWTPDGVSVGALTTFRTIETDERISSKYPALRDASRVIAGVQLRNLATIGGNLANASPAADSVPPLVALGARVTVASRGLSQAMPVEECITGPGRTLLTPGQIFTTISIPEPKPRSGNAFLRFSPRSAMDIGIVSVATSVTLDSEGRCQECRIALGAVSAKPMRATAAEENVTGQRMTPELAERSGDLAAAAAEPISDIRGSADYRRAIVRVFTVRTLQQAAQAAERAKEGA